MTQSTSPFTLILVFHAGLLQGCFADQSIPDDCGNLTVIVINNNAGGSKDTAEEDGGDIDTDFPLDNDTGDFILDGDYSLWSEADDSWAPGEVTSIVDETHPGWNNARCFECHGVGTPWEPVDHDPRMQHWAWSCSRGFPGGTCHGHGINGADGFNHNGAAYFYGCTRLGCHETYNAEMKNFENHGFMKTPDEFCNACHDYFWSGWPTAAK